MKVPAPLEITASLMAGYRFTDGSWIEVNAAGDYRITDASGETLAETVDTRPGEGLHFGTPPEDYGEVMSDLAAFLQADSEEIECREMYPDDEFLSFIFSEKAARWALSHADELSELAYYREDKRLEEVE